MKRITSVTIEIQMQSDEPGALQDATRRVAALKETAAHLVSQNLHRQAPAAIAAMLELFDTAKIKVQLSPTGLETVDNPHAN